MIDKDWNGKDVQVAYSKGGKVPVLSDPFNNLIRTGMPNWPPIEIVQKLYKGNDNNFASDDKQKCTDSLGYYCDLQSIHSEDAITWSVFGTISYAGKAIKEQWVSELFKAINLPAVASTDNAEIFLWRRIPHPDTLVSGGPEIDVGIITSDTVILCEAKWTSSVGQHQGKSGTKDQIQLRGEFLEKYGKKIFRNKRHFCVLGITINDNGVTNTVPESVIFKSITWEKLCSAKSHSLSEEVYRYYNWKLNNSTFRKGTS